MHLAFSFALSALIMIEYVRHFRVWPAGMQIHTFLSTFLDQRDCGPVILSHLYLLLVARFLIPNQVAIAGLSGVLTLGIGDTLASVIGQRFGKNKWFGTSKTIEGTLAFIISLLVSDVAITSIFFSGISIQTVLSSLLCACLTGILEATSDQNDNLVIPIFHLAIRNLF
ncbi:hypothetical protein BC829DRAFT_396004 [Chytridium lagenaria]|nr:hypothetical protein BC829DRAFT_396004 [Chytridium lagenaria]